MEAKLGLSSHFFGPSYMLTYKAPPLANKRAIKPPYCRQQLIDELYWAKDKLSCGVLCSMHVRYATT